MNYAKLAHAIATLGPIGHLPAPGTAATFVCMGILLVLGKLGLPTGALIWALVPLVGLGMIIVHGALQTLTSHDPQEIVFDEVLGYCLAQSIFPLSFFWLASGMIIFRVLDILKPLGIRYCERFEGAAGVICDDLLAGFYTQIILVAGRIGLEVWFGC